MKCMHPEGTACEGKATHICCYIKKEGYLPRVEFSCDSWITQKYQSGKIDTLVVWHCQKELERLERSMFRNWRLRRWMKKMKGSFKDSLLGTSSAIFHKAIEDYDDLSRTVKF